MVKQASAWNQVRRSICRQHGLGPGQGQELFRGADGVALRTHQSFIRENVTRRGIHNGLELVPDKGPLDNGIERFFALQQVPFPVVGLGGRTP